MPWDIQASIFLLVPNPEIGRVAAGRASGIKPWGHWDNSCSHLCGCCKPASGHTVRGRSERVPATNQEPHLIQNG